MAELSVAEMVGRLLLAAALGAMIGAERELSGQDAGLRTHLMLALGAGLFGLISVGAWDDFASTTNATNYRVDVTRVASYVAAGIGFIGGGAILKTAGGIRGLTTAASLWVAAAVGLACGVGFWIPALTAAIAALLSLAALKPVRALVRRLGEGRQGNLLVHVANTEALNEFMRIINDEVPQPPLSLRVGPRDGGGFEAVVEYSPAEPALLIDIASRLSQIDDVSSVHLAR